MEIFIGLGNCLGNYSGNFSENCLEIALGTALGIAQGMVQFCQLMGKHVVETMVFTSQHVQFLHFSILTFYLCSTNHKF